MMSSTFLLLANWTERRVTTVKCTTLALKSRLSYYKTFDINLNNGLQTPNNTVTTYFT